MEANEQRSPDAYSMEYYRTQLQSFTKVHAQAKDFVKFLTTLERQFKNITRGELTVIEETLPSLLNGLKLIWTISRHIYQNEGKMEDLLDSISNEICDKVRAQIDIKRIFKIKPETAISIIDQGVKVLDSWHSLFFKTKSEIERDNSVKRWEFTKTKEIFQKPRYMKEILEDLKKACIML
jgi:dynein heavy chain